MLFYIDLYADAYYALAGLNCALTIKNMKLEL